MFMSSRPSQYGARTPAEIEKDIGPRGTVRIATHNRGDAQVWLIAMGAPATLAKSLRVGVLDLLYNDPRYFNTSTAPRPLPIVKPLMALLTTRLVEPDHDLATVSRSRPDATSAAEMMTSAIRVWSVSGKARCPIRSVQARVTRSG